ncbi:MAG: Crp/Fnr family transcriptional regulator [Bacteroidia bacterium]|nr:Crp/Fnr family transcriptional regulator [Bacteroidia bacterium]
MEDLIIKIILECNKLFGACTQKEWSIIETQSNEKKFKKGQLLFTESDTVKYIHIMISGKVKLYKTGANGNNQILSLAIEGDIIGYRGLVGNGKYIATAEVLEDCSTLLVPKELVIILLEHNKKFMMGFLKLMAKTISEVEEKSVFFIQKTSKERLAEALLFLERKYGVNAENYLQIQLTREDLGAYTGLASETIIRILKSWQSEGLVELHKKYIKIAKRQELIQLANR